MLSCYQCNKTAVLCERVSNRLFCAPEHQELYHEGYTELLNLINTQPLLNRRVLQCLGMKRLAEEEQTLITLSHFESVPDEIVLEILLFTFPLVGIDVRQTQLALRLRETDLRLRDLIDRYLLPRVTKLSWFVMDYVRDDTTLLLFTGLKELSFRQGKARNITGNAVSQMTRLESLDIGDKTMARVGTDAIQALTNLRELVVGNNPQITDEALLTLSKLERLELTSSMITFEGIGRVLQLKHLSLVLMPSSMSKSLYLLTRLESLEIYRDDSIVDDDILSLSSTLTTLKLNSCPLLSDRSLRQMTRLVSLALDGNNLDGMTDVGLSVLTNLKTLSLANNYVISNAGLASLSQLTELNLSDNDRITAIGFAPFMKTLRVLRLYYTYLVTWDTLSLCPSLKEVYMPLGIHALLMMFGSTDPAILERIEQERGVKFIDWQNEYISKRTEDMKRILNK